MLLDTQPQGPWGTSEEGGSSSGPILDLQSQKLEVRGPPCISEELSPRFWAHEHLGSAHLPSRCPGLLQPGVTCCPFPSPMADPAQDHQASLPGAGPGGSASHAGGGPAEPLWSGGMH